MTQPSRTTESISRDNAAIREVMHRARELTVPDRATLAVGLVGHLATMMNRSQMARLLDELRTEVERVQDVPPLRQQEFDARTSEPASGGQRRPDRTERVEGGGRDDDRGGAGGERGTGRARVAAADRAPADVGQGGRGEFRASGLL